MPSAIQAITPAARDAIVQEHFEAEGGADIPAILATLLRERRV